jgi:hypothetical protein
MIYIWLRFHTFVAPWCNAVQVMNHYKAELTKEKRKRSQQSSL